MYLIMVRKTKNLVGHNKADEHRIFDLAMILYDSPQYNSSNSLVQRYQVIDSNEMFLLD